MKTSKDGDDQRAENHEKLRGKLSKVDDDGAEKEALANAKMLCASSRINLGISRSESRCSIHSKGGHNQSTHPPIPVLRVPPALQTTFPSAIATVAVGGLDCCLCSTLTVRAIGDCLRNRLWCI